MLVDLLPKPSTEVSVLFEIFRIFFGRFCFWNVFFFFFARGLGVGHCLERGG